MAIVVRSLIYTIFRSDIFIRLAGRKQYLMKLLHKLKTKYVSIKFKKEIAVFKAFERKTVNQKSFKECLRECFKKFFGDCFGEYL